MNKFIKVILSIVIIILLVLIFSPIISLFLPIKLTNHTYYRLLYHVIADKETKNCLTDEEKVLKLFQYVIDHEFHQGIPYKCKPAESLIYGEAYCDFKARTLNSLLGILNIPSRYAMLIDTNDPPVSCHTLNEVFLYGKWCVFDSSINIIFKNDKEENITLEDMSGDFNLISNERKFAALKNYKAGYGHFISWFQRMFPIVYKPDRSTPCMYQAHIFDRIADTYFKTFKYSFFNLYQDIYLKFKKTYSGQKDFKLFFMARNYHLAYRYNSALKYYDALLKKYPESKYIEDAVFFCGMLYFEMRNYPKSIEFFKLIIDKYSAKWKNASYYYLGKNYTAMADNEKALIAYSNVSYLLLPTQILEELNKRGL